jgi:hypothetical protein
MDCYEMEKETGLIIVDTLEEEGLSYEFNKLGVFLHKESGRFFWAGTSGCSCPSDWHESTFNGPNDNDITEIKRHTFKDFEAAVMNFPATYEEKLKFIAKAREAIKNQKALKV